MAPAHSVPALARVAWRRISRILLILSLLPSLGRAALLGPVGWNLSVLCLLAICTAQIALLLSARASTCDLELTRSSSNCSTCSKSTPNSPELMCGIRV